MDESFVQLETLRIKKKSQPVPKHLPKVHVWGGISARGATCTCTSVVILDSALVPFIKNHYFEVHAYKRIMILNIPVYGASATWSNKVSTGGILCHLALTLTQLRMPVDPEHEIHSY